MGVLILNETEVRALVSPAVALEAARTAFRSLAGGRAQQPASMDMEIPDRRAEMHVKGAYLPELALFGVKAASAFYENREHAVPVHSGLSLAFDASTGFLRAIVLDNGYLTELRTGAAGALAAELLAVDEPSVVGIIGTGGQARYQLAALLEVRRPEVVKVCGRDRGRAQAFADEIRITHSLRAEVADSPEEVVRDSDIVVTTTPTRQPIVAADWIHPGLHITAMGSDFPSKQELDVGVLAQADRVVADTVANCLRSGEVHHAVEAGVLDVAGVEELGEIVVGRRPRRQRDDEITVADLCGLGAQDTAIVDAAVGAALEQSVGTRLAM